METPDYLKESGETQEARPPTPRDLNPGDSALFLARIDRLIRLGDRLLRCLKEARDGLR